MAINIDPFETRVMVEAVRQIPEPTTFLLDTFFKRIQTSDSEHVDIDVIKGSRRMATFVRRESEARIVDKEGFTMQSVKLPYTSEKKEITPQDLSRRPPGGNVYGPPISLAELVRERQEKLVRRVKFLEEKMAADALFLGITTIQGKGVDAQVDWGYIAGDHTVTLVGADLWTDANSDPPAKLREIKRITSARGTLTPRIAIFGHDVVDAWYAHDKVQKLLDNRRINLGKFDHVEMPEGVTHLGTFENLDIFSYDGKYHDGTQEQFYVPVDKILIGSTMARTERHYGAIEDFELPGGKGEMQYFSKMYKTDDPSRLWVLVKSRPLPCLFQPDAFSIYKVV